MSSLWQNSTTKIRLKPSKTLNESLPSLNHHPKVLKKKGSSQSIHQVIKSNEAKIQRDKEKALIRNLQENRQALANLCSKSYYKLPSNIKQVDTQIVEFGQALFKIEDVFNEQFNVDLGDCNKGKRSAHQKVGFKKLNQFQNNTIENNPKRLAKRQFQQIFRLFERRPLKCMQNTIKQSNPQTLIRRRKQNTIILSMQKQRQKSQQKRFDQNLSQLEKEEFMKKTQAFQKAEKHLILKSYTVKILYHHLNAELAIEAAMFEEAIQSLYYCEYYARKIDFDLYIVPCLIMQSEVKQSLYEFDEAIKILKTALEFSIVKKWKQMEMRILEKVSIVYYYRGNSYMAKYYKELSEIGMSPTERDIYVKEYSKSEELKSLEARLFYLPFDSINKKKHNQKYQFDISRDLFLDHENMILSQHEEVSSMLRSNKTSKIGIKLRKLIIDNSQRAQVTRFSLNHTRKDSEILPRFIGFDYPLENCSQILKSHLSKGRLGVGHKNRGVNFLRTFGFMKTLYRRLNYQLLSANRGLQVKDKENLVGMKV